MELVNINDRYDRNNAIKDKFIVFPGMTGPSQNHQTEILSAVPLPCTNSLRGMSVAAVRETTWPLKTSPRY